MPILATNNATQRELIPAGNYPARCYSMVQIGTVTEVIKGEAKTLHKVRISWELPTELKVFKEENGEQPYVISEEYTLSMNEKANLRKMLASWRGKDFIEEEAKCFDITKLLGKPCLLNVIHKPGTKDPSKIYEAIGSVSSVPKGMEVPEQINKTVLLSYDNFDHQVFASLPDFVKDKIKTSQEYAKLQNPNEVAMNSKHDLPDTDDLPF